MHLPAIFMTAIYYTYSSEYSDSVPLDQLLEKLPSIFHERARRYRKKEDAYNFVLGRLLLHKVINKRKLGLDIASMYYNEEGKPFLDGLFFSISHSQNLVACAISLTQTIGLDVEYPRLIEKRHFRSYFSDTEWSNIVADETLHTFYAYWTQKEAILKAGGVGLDYLLNITIQDRGEAILKKKGGVEEHYYTSHLELGDRKAYTCLCTGEDVNGIGIGKVDIEV